MASNKKTEYSIYLFIYLFSKFLRRLTLQEFGRGVKFGGFLSVNL